MKQLFSLMLGIVLFIPTLHAQNKIIVKDFVKNDYVTEVTTPNGKTYLMPDKPILKSYGQDNEPISTSNLRMGTCKVTFIYKEMPGSRPFNLTIYNKDNGKQTYDFEGDKTFTKDIKPGKYSMHAIFDKQPVGMCFIFKEDIEIKADTTLIFNESEGTNQMQIKTYDENGNELLVDLWEGNKIIEKGNAESMTTNSVISDSEFGNTALILGGSYRVKDHLVDLYFNNVSDKIHFGEIRMMSVGKNIYFIKYSTQLNKAKILKNNYQKLALVKQKFEPTIFGRDMKSPRFRGYVMWPSDHGSPQAQVRGYNSKIELKDNTVEMFVELTENDNDFFQGLVNPMMSDNYQIKKENGKERKEYSFIRGLPLVGDADGIKYIDYGYDSFGGYMINTKKMDYEIYPGHPIFSFNSSSKYIFGKSTPIVSTKLDFYQGSIYCIPTFIGRYGEVLEANSKFNIDFEEGKQDDMNFIKLSSHNIHLDDNVNGTNECKLVFNPTSKDKYPPTLQMLRFINGDGLITDHFENPNELTLQIAAGDFEYAENENLWMFYYYWVSKPEIKVLYAPNGKDTWKEVIMKEVQNNFYLPGFGNFFEGKIPSIKEKGYRGWYDLKVILTDKSNNSTEQILRGAFHLSAPEYQSTTHISNNNISLKLYNKCIHIEGTENPKIEIFSMDGVREIAIKSNCCDINNLSKGIHIVKITSQEEVLVEKITI